MDGFTDAQIVLAGIALALLVGVASWALYTGVRFRLGAKGAAADRDRLSRLATSGPAQALILHADDRLEMPQRVADWFGLAAPATHLSELTGSGVLPEEDVAALATHLSGVQRAGRSFALPLRPVGGAKVLRVEGMRAPSGVGGPATALLWVFDASESETRIAELEAHGEILSDGLEALTGLIEAAPLPMWYRGTDLRLAMVNTAYVDAVEGEDAAGVVSRGMELVEATGAGGALSNAAEARESQRPQAMTVPVTIAGARRTMRVIDVPLPGGGIAGFAVDLEEAEQSRAGLKRFMEAQRELLDRLSAGVAQFGPDHTLVYCNQPFRRMFAVRSEWLAESPTFDRMLERMREVNRLPEVRDFPAWKTERHEWFIQADTAMEEAWHLSGGDHIRVVAQPLPDGGLLLIFEDRTEQVQLASARDTLLRVRTATFDNLFEALGVFAADGRLQLWNNRFRALWGFEEEFLSGHPRIDAIAARVANRLVNPSRAKFMAELIRVATTERQQQGGRVSLADGRHFDFAAVPLPDGNALFTMLDVSDSHRIEHALREKADAFEAADRVKTEFVASMSYELRTPLTSISGFAEMLNGGYAGKLSPEADSYVEAILESVERLSILVDDVLNLTLSEDTGARLERVDVDVAAAAREGAEALRPIADRSEIDFAIEIDDSAGRVTGDPARVREIVEHLLRHAMGAAPEQGRVLLHVDGDADAARIVVSDDGEGMDEQTAARAFDRFAQPGITSSGERALDLGLPLAKQFAEAHGGTVTLVSEPGEGTMVTVELPRQ